MPELFAELDGGTTNDEACQEDCREAARLLLRAFAWAASTEGYGPWARVYERLAGLGRGEPL